MELRRCIFCLNLYSEDGKYWSCVKAGLGDKEFTWRNITSMKEAPDNVLCDFKLNPLVRYVASRIQHKAIITALREDKKAGWP